MTNLRLATLAALLVCAGQTLTSRAPAADPTPAKPVAAPLTAASFARIAADTDALLTGKPPSPGTFNLFKTYDNHTFTYKRNPTCITAGLDLSCISVANSADADGTGGNRGCVTLITPMHGVTNDHFAQPYQTGVTHYFVDRANTVYARKIIGSKNVAGTDLRVVVFDPPLPASVIPASLLPAGVAERLLPPGTPLLSTNQQKRVVITELAGFAGGEIVVRPAVAPARRAWTASPPAVLGDSDSPTFVLIDRRPRLLFTYHTNITGPSVSDNLPAIRAMLWEGYLPEVATVR